MERREGSAKTFAYGFVVFVTLGITIANETLSRFGQEGNYLIAFSIALVLAGLLVVERIWLSLIVLVGVITINLPEATLASLYLDRDVLFAAICGVILVPTVYDLMTT